VNMFNIVNQQFIAMHASGCQIYCTDPDLSRVLVYTSTSNKNLSINGN